MSRLIMCHRAVTTSEIRSSGSGIPARILKKAVRF